MSAAESSSRDDVFFSASIASLLVRERLLRVVLMHDLIDKVKHRHAVEMRVSACPVAG